MEEFLKKYNTSEEGLSSSEVTKRQNQNGLNELKEKKKKSAVMLFLEQFIDVLIALLIVAAIAAYFVGDVIDSCVILIAVLLNTVIGFIQEYRSEKAIEMLKSVTTSYAVVRRDGQVQKIDAKELTIGDIVILEEGDKIPADLVLIETNRLKVDESNLTGESVPVEKSPKEEAYMDSNVTLGNGVGIVTAIGMDTSIGKIAEVIQEEKGETPLQKKMDKLGKTLSVIAIIVCVFIFIFELFRGIPIVETFLTAVSLAVAAIPEGLPAVLTLTLALGMQQLTKSNAIVRRLLSVETLGSCTVICSDKTGTLTENKMTVRDAFFYNENKSLEINALCNNSTIRDGKTIGDPTDGAVLKYSQDNNYFKEDLQEKFPRVDEIPLDSSRKMMTTIHENGEKYLVLTKGAPEIIIGKCKHIDNNGSVEILDDSVKETLTEKINEMSDNALRVLGIAYKNTENIEDNVENDLIFTGLVGIIDPPKKNVDKSIAACKKAGIKVRMITGDHLKTAASIAREIGILTDGKVIDGETLDKLSDEEYFEMVDDIQVYARVKPEQKMRIVETLKQKGEIVSMTGDGVNDAPALTRANIGMAIGAGTDVAIDAADVVLMKSNLKDVPAAIRLSKAVLRNIHENLFWAFIYNIIGIPLAAGIWYPIFGWKLNPMFGAAAMSLSSFCVVTNALRLNLVNIYNNKKDRKIKNSITEVIGNNELSNNLDNKESEKETNTMEKTMKITGMMCGHCEATVKKALEALEQVDEAIVSHEEGTAVVKLNSDLSNDVLKKTVEDKDYTVNDIIG